MIVSWNVVNMCLNVRLNESDQHEVPALSLSYPQSFAYSQLLQKADIFVVDRQDAGSWLYRQMWRVDSSYVVFGTWFTFHYRKPLRLMRTCPVRPDDQPYASNVIVTVASGSIRYDPTSSCPIDIHWYPCCYSGCREVEYRWISNGRFINDSKWQMVFKVTFSSDGMHRLADGRAYWARRIIKLV